jgi:hypothetical protein
VFDLFGGFGIMVYGAIQLGEEKVRKRLKKKLAKERCPKCGGEDGIRGWRMLRTGRWVPSELSCFHCDMGVPIE